VGSRYRYHVLSEACHEALVEDRRPAVCGVANFEVTLENPLC